MHVCVRPTNFVFLCEKWDLKCNGNVPQSSFWLRNNNEPTWRFMTLSLSLTNKKTTFNNIFLKDLLVLFLNSTPFENNNEQNSYYYQTNRWRAYFPFTKEANKQQENGKWENIFVYICTNIWCIQPNTKEGYCSQAGQTLYFRILHFVCVFCVCVSVCMLYYYNIYRKWYDMPRVCTFENLPASISVSSCILYYYRQTITHTVCNAISIPCEVASNVAVLTKPRELEIHWHFFF